MTRLIFMIGVLFLFVTQSNSQDLEGAWSLEEDGVTRWLLMVDGCFTWTKYATVDGFYQNTVGGTYQNNSDQIIATIEFNPHDSTEVGQTLRWKYDLADDKLSIRLKDDQPFEFTKSKSSDPADLSGAFLFSGRKRDGEITRRDTDQPRKTMKILVGDRFQWIAYHVTDKKFMGTGGGNYASVDGVYTENIEFFSRNQSRVGASLEFNYEVVDGEWHHTGNSSSGKPLYEIWSKRKDSLPKY